MHSRALRNIAAAYILSTLPQHACLGMFVARVVILRPCGTPLAASEQTCVLLTLAAWLLGTALFVFYHSLVFAGQQAAAVVMCSCHQDVIQ
jgi:hypothetical protein